MGLESYYFKLLPNGISINEILQKRTIEYSPSRTICYEGVSNMLSEGLKLYLKEHGYSIVERYVDDDLGIVELEVDDCIKLTLEQHNDYVVCLNFEAAFSWFEEGRRYLYELCKCINSTFGKCRLFFSPDLYFDVEENFFESKLVEIYDVKYQSFLKTFPDFKQKVLPDTAFYKAYEISSRSDLIRKWVSRVFKTLGQS